MTTPPTLLERLPRLGETLEAADAILDRFVEYVSALGIDLYPAQQDALLELLADKNVILDTPTGSGKSLVALALHFKAMAEDKRSIYTSPIKALVNEKFFALCEAFHPDNVGLSTGDATVNPGAPIVCCTAEILANMALREGERTDVDYVVMDEFHFYADRDRGVAWQVPLLTLPHARFLLMSATLGDMTFFERAITDLNGRPTVVVRSDDRPVPLSFSYWPVPLHEAVERLIAEDKAPIYIVSFTQRSCHDEAQSLMSTSVADKDRKRSIADELDGFRFDSPYGKIVQRFVRHGVGIHHGGMLPRYRRLVERLAKRGLLRVISGTDTLGVGVNIPIRSVVLTKLCKYDGAATRILSVRDFRQICGRAGRKGYDDAGSVVALAPEHVSENLRLDAKASKDQGKKKKLVKKKPPTRGYIHWDEQTFRRLVASAPEPLLSRFSVSHGMLLEVLGREHGGCRAMKGLIRSCHDRRAEQHRHAKTAIQMFRSLVEAEVISLVPDPDRPGIKKPAVHVDLQREFSLHYTLSLYVVETIRLLDKSFESYPLDVLSLVEAILEDPGVILDKQLDRLRGEAVARMKAEGIEYDARMQELEKIEHPKPNAKFIYATFEEFSARHPWVGHNNIRPKGAAREVYEQCHDFKTFVQGYKLERSEGLVLRYLTEAYKALVQTVPEHARTVELDAMIETFGAIVRGVDSSLIEEWERLRDPDYVPRPEAEAPAPLAPRSLVSDPAAFTVLVRNAVFRVVRALAARDWPLLAELVEAEEGEEPWSAERFERVFAPYYEDHERIRTDPRARSTEHCVVDSGAVAVWSVEQRLVDPDEHDDWLLDLRVPLERSVAEERPVLVLRSVVS